MIDLRRHVQVIGASGEISRVDLLAPEVFDVPETCLFQFCGYFSRSEEQPERFAGSGHAALHALKDESLQQSQRGRLNWIIQRDPAAGRQGADKLNRGSKGLMRQVHHHAEPRKKCRFFAMEAGFP